MYRSPLGPAWGLGLWGLWLAIALVGGSLGAVVSRVLAPAGGTDVLEVAGSREGTFSPVPGEADSLGSEVGWHPSTFGGMALP